MARNLMLAVASMVFGAFVTPQSAFATDGILCSGADDSSVSVYLTVGTTPGFGLVEADISTPDTSWTTYAEAEGDRVVIAQASILGEFLVADFADANAEIIVASLRLVRVENDLGLTGAGVLSLPGGGAWSVVCDFG